MKYLRFLVTLCPVLLFAFMIDNHLNSTITPVEKEILFIPRFVLGGFIAMNLLRIHRWIWGNDDFKERH